MIISDVSSANARQPLADLLETIRRRRMLLIVPVVAGVCIGLRVILPRPSVMFLNLCSCWTCAVFRLFPMRVLLRAFASGQPGSALELDIISSRMMARKVIDILQAENIFVPTEFRSRTVLSSASDTAEQQRGDRGVDAEARERQRIDLCFRVFA